MGNQPPRQNNFDLLRLALTLGVLLMHLGALSQTPALLAFSRHVRGDLCVYCFFIVSGYLICRSYERSSSFWQYVSKRVRRIAPGYLGVLVAAALLGAALTELRLVDYLSSAGLWRYLFWNGLLLNFLEPTLPGVFTAQPQDSAVNGALWSIRIEVFCYALTPAWVMVARRLGYVWTWLGTCLLLLGCWWWLRRPAGGNFASLLAAGLVIPLLYFFTGAMLHDLLRTGRRIPHAWGVAAGVTAWLLSGETSAWGTPALVLPLAVLMLYLGEGLPYLGNGGKYGDLSYGTYIYHFPVIQGAVALGVLQRWPGWGTLGVLLVVLVLAWLSWHLVEKPWLLRSSHYRQAEGGQ